jgi:leader peptidase (prepilin peptidase)/N-methyltransferase
MVLGGRCRHCRAPISARYPLVELTTGVAFAGIGWGFGAHWAVAGFCVLAATLVVLVAVAGDGLGPPLSVAVIGTAMAVVVLGAAAVSDRHWSRVVGVVVAVAVAGALVAVARPYTESRVEAPSWVAAAPVLLPAGTALGWLGPPSVGIGVATAAVVFLGARAIQRVRRTTSPRAGAAICLALGAGVVVATVVAVTVGSGAGS